MPNDKDNRITPDGRLVLLQKERRARLLDAKCATPGCWHQREQGSIFCCCCYDNKCSKFTAEEIALCLSAEE